MVPTYFWIDFWMSLHILKYEICNGVGKRLYQHDCQKSTDTGIFLHCMHDVTYAENSDTKVLKIY